MATNKMTGAALWDQQRRFFNHPKTQFRVEGRVAKTLGFASLADANRAARRAARYARNSAAAPPSHLAEKLSLLRLQK